MKFVINTKYTKSAGYTVLCGLESRLRASGSEVVINDWENYAKYEVAIFMAPDSKIKEAKIANPKLKCLLFDPKVSRLWQIEEVKQADLLIVSSIEQKNALLRYNKNIFIYYMFPDTPEIKKEHSKKDKIIIGYHGNKQHLDAMCDVSYALDELAKKFPIEFWAIYNIDKLGQWSKNTPKICPVRHIQWREDDNMSNLNVLAECDIGVAPSLMPVNRIFTRPLSSLFFNKEGYHYNDYIQRFKFSNNPGRIYVFSQLHIPVVTDFTPSACQIIKDGESGLLVGTREGWLDALERLAQDNELRNKLSTNLKNSIDASCSVDSNFRDFLSLLNLDYVNK